MSCKLLRPTDQYWFLDLTALKSSFWTVRVLSASSDLVLWSRRICLVVFFRSFFVDTGTFYLGFAGRWPTTKSGSFRKTAGSVARKTSTDCKFIQHFFLSSSSVCLIVSLVYTSVMSNGLQVALSVQARSVGVLLWNHPSGDLFAPCFKWPYHSSSRSMLPPPSFRPPPH